MKQSFSVHNGKMNITSKRKALLCPKCGRGRLIDESISIRSELRVVDDDAWPADYYAKCAICKAQVGVRKIE